MNTKHLFLAVAAVAFAACAQMEKPIENIEDIVPETPAYSDTPIALAYSTVDAVETKAAQNLNEGTFASGEDITVLISNTGANEWSDYTFTTGDAGAMNATDPAPYYPAGTQNIDIVAYYPATADVSFTVATDQTSDASYKASDLMFASVSNQAKQAEAVNLAFAHKMAKLNVNITPGQGVSSITGLSVLNVKPTVSFDQATGEVGAADGTATSIAMSNEGSVIIPAQTISGGLLSIVTDKGTATYSVTDKVFEAGKLYTINITVNLRAVGTTTEITGWTSEGTVVVNPVVEVATILNVTSEHLGWVIAGDGTIYPNKEAVEAVGKTGVAIIFYVGDHGSADASSSQYRGLAVSISTNGQWQWGYQDNAVYCLESQYEDYSGASADMNGILNTQILSSHTHTVSGRDKSHSAAMAAKNLTPEAPKGTSGWFLGSVGQWNLYLHSCGITPNGDGYSGDATLEKLRTYFSAAGYESSWTGGKYWTSTESTNASNRAPLAWKVYLGTSDNDYFSSGLGVLKDLRDYAAVVRPFTAF